MANYFKCDMCGCETSLYPKEEQVYEKKTQVVKSWDAEKMEHVETVQEYDAPLVKAQEFQNPLTQKTETRMMPVKKPLSKKTVIVRMSVGQHDSVQRDFCEECFGTLQKQCDKLMRRLKGIEPK